MAMVQRAESTVGPVAVGGRTITLVARARVFRLGERFGALGLRARPTHVEILDEEGRHQVVRIRDIESTAMAAIILAGAGYVLAVRALRRRSSA